MRAALELITSNKPGLAARTLALAGEPLLGALLSLAQPEEGCFEALAGAAEQCYAAGVDPRYFVALGRGSAQ